MKNIALIIAQFILLPFCISGQSFVDPETLAGTLRDNDNIGAGWSLNFNDEFSV
ncbi:MAG: hypothetical protein RBS07_18500 [Lentimicrobium sp.]|jgi:hypothetical protein|nr:hypothetical protein [Lentimicrobium sp.]